MFAHTSLLSRGVRKLLCWCDASVTYSVYYFSVKCLLMSRCQAREEK
jgi:hypothetical protein